MTIQDLKKDFTISLSSNVSMHAQIGDYFRMKIKSGELKPEEQIVVRLIPNSEQISVSATICSSGFNSPDFIFILK